MTIVASLTNSNYFYFWDKTCKQKNPIRTPNNLLKSQAVEEEHHNVFYVKSLYFCSSSWIFSSGTFFLIRIHCAALIFLYLKQSFNILFVKHLICSGEYSLCSCSTIDKKYINISPQHPPAGYWGRKVSVAYRSGGVDPDSGRSDNRPLALWSEWRQGRTVSVQHIVAESVRVYEFSPDPNLHSKFYCKTSKLYISVPGCYGSATL